MKFSFVDYDSFDMNKKKLCHFWIHTSFIKNHYLCLSKPDLDGNVGKDKEHRKYPPNFKIELFFSNP